MLWLLLGPPGFTCWISFATVFSWVGTYFTEVFRFFLGFNAEVHHTSNVEFEKWQNNSLLN